VNSNLVLAIGGELPDAGGLVMGRHILPEDNSHAYCSRPTLINLGITATDRIADEV
jgi:hypothetical protein